MSAPVPEFLDGIVRLAQRAEHPASNRSGSQSCSTIGYLPPSQSVISVTNKTSST